MRPFAILALSLLLALPLAAAALPTPVLIIAAGASFTPAAVVVPAGTTIQWRSTLLSHTVLTADSMVAAVARDANDPANTDGEPDTFRARVAMGATFSHTFATPGSFPYFCDLHPAMVGLVEVI